jgi:hypothetical protein
MDSKRWTLGVVLVATVSLWGLVEADASPFASYILSDDLGNVVNGSAPEVSGGQASAASSTGESASDGTENDGHGNNADGVDSSNKGQGQGGPTDGVDESCPEGGECIDDEIKTNSGKKQ